MGCKGLHCEGCKGGGPAGAVIVLVVIIALAARKAMPAIVSAVEIAAWTVAGVAGAALVITGGVLAARVIRGRRARRAVVYRSGLVIPAYRTVIRTAGPRAERPAIDPPRGQAAGSWPLPGWRDDIRPRIGGDGDEHRTR